MCLCRRKGRKSRKRSGCGWEVSLFSVLFEAFVWLHWVLVAACGILSMQTLSCDMWDLVP